MPAERRDWRYHVVHGGRLKPVDATLVDDSIVPKDRGGLMKEPLKIGDVVGPIRPDEVGGLEENTVVAKTLGADEEKLFVFEPKRDAGEPPKPQETVVASRRPRGVRGGHLGDVLRTISGFVRGGFGGQNLEDAEGADTGADEAISGGSALDHFERRLVDDIIQKYSRLITQGRVENTQMHYALADDNVKGNILGRVRQLPVEDKIMLQKIITEMGVGKEIKDVQRDFAGQLREAASQARHNTESEGGSVLDGVERNVIRAVFEEYKGEHRMHELTSTPIYKALTKSTRQDVLTEVGRLGAADTDRLKTIIDGLMGASKFRHEREIAFAGDLVKALGGI